MARFSPSPWEPRVSFNFMMYGGHFFSCSRRLHPDSGPPFLGPLPAQHQESWSLASASAWPVDLWVLLCRLILSGPGLCMARCGQRHCVTETGRGLTKRQMHALAAFISSSRFFFRSFACPLLSAAAQAILLSTPFPLHLLRWRS